jgi:hypothetical protein
LPVATEKSFLNECCLDVGCDGSAHARRFVAALAIDGAFGHPGVTAQEVRYIAELQQRLANLVLG